MKWSDGAFKKKLYKTFDAHPEENENYSSIKVINKLKIFSYLFDRIILFISWIANHKIMVLAKMKNDHKSKTYKDQFYLFFDRLFVLFLSK